MKLRFVYTIFSLAFLAVLFLSNSSGRAAGQNWGNTGAPGDQTLGNGTPRTCQSCHATGDIQVTLDIEVLDASDNPITTYTPNEVYTAKVKINHVSGPMPQGYGFQIISLFDKDTTDVKGWTETGHSNNVQIATASNTSRIYAEHDGTSDSNEFLIKWQAPDAGNGEITFYAAGSGVNRNGSTGGDGAATPQKLTLTESGTATSIQDLSTIGLGYTIAPNPISDQFFLKLNSENNKEIDIKIVTTQGQIIYENSANLNQGLNDISINTSDFATGIYLLQIASEGAIGTKKLIKY